MEVAENDFRNLAKLSGKLNICKNLENIRKKTEQIGNN
jgi:hypothetical protein